MVEQSTVNARVGGSNPSWGANNMLIIFTDEYEELIKTVHDSMIPRVGDLIVIDSQDEWQVTKVLWKTQLSDSKAFERVVVSVKLAEDIRIPRETKVDDSGRLREMSNAIIQTNKRLDESDKKARLVRDQVSSLRSHVKRNTPKPKDPNVTN